MSVIKSVIDYFERYSEIPNSSLVRNIANEIATTNPTLDEEAVFVETVIKLRTDYGYRHPIEEQSDINDTAPYLAKTSHRGRKEIG
jgi:hypothetical protein